MKTSNGGGQTIGEVLDGLLLCLDRTSDIPSLDAQLLMAHLLSRSRAWILTHPEALLSSDQVLTLEKQVNRLQKGEPLPYILGTWEFYGLEFEVTPDVLIPRPETELLLDRALSWLRKSNARNEKLRVLDVGTGSGCIPIALAMNETRITLTATDISSAALNIARKNAERMNVSDRITFIEADLFPNLPNPDRYSLITANLPYIPTLTLQKTLVYGREPTLALDGGSDGLVIIRRFLENSPDWLHPGGLLLVEIETSEGQAIKEMASGIFPLGGIQLYKDLAGHDRLLEVQT
jgi:release factor glutamine methyltransferase